MRDTLEFPGGHREAEEFIVDTAERELKEETGAKDFTLEPVCIYGVKEGDGDETYGMLCVADITSFEPFDSEIEKIVITDTLPLCDRRETQEYLSFCACKGQIYPRF